MHSSIILCVFLRKSTENFIKNPTKIPSNFFKKLLTANKNDGNINKHSERGKNNTKKVLKKSKKSIDNPI